MAFITFAKCVWSRLQVVGESMPVRSHLLPCLPLYQQFSKRGPGTSNISIYTELCKNAYSQAPPSRSGESVLNSPPVDCLETTLPFTMKAGRLTRNLPDFLVAEMAM